MSMSLSRPLHIHIRSVIEPTQVPSVVCVSIVSMLNPTSALSACLFHSMSPGSRSMSLHRVATQGVLVG